MKRPSHSRSKLQQLRSALGRLGRWLLHHKKRVLIIVGSALLIWLLTLVSIGIWFQQKHKNDPYEPGVSFSVKYAKELGINWQEAYTAALDDLKFRHLRLMSYWDDTEPAPDQFNFTDLDWQMNEAAKRGTKVTLTLGKRQPRWPECHQPLWVEQLTPAKQDVELLAFIKEVTNRYKNHPALESYQLENEIANRLFAPHCRTFNRAMLQQEVDTVKQIDAKHPLIINVSNQSGIPWRGPIGDKVGFSIYNIAYARFGPFGYYFSFGWVPAWWHSMRGGLIEILHGKQVFIHELQTEPWGPAATKELTLEEQNRSMDSERMQQQVAFGKRIGMKRMYLWGVEWWYWRKTQFNDPTTWDTARELVKDPAQKN